MQRRAHTGWIRSNESAQLRLQIANRCRLTASRIDWRAALITTSVQVGLLALLLSSITTASPQRASLGNSGISVFSLASANKPQRAEPKPVDALIVPPPPVRAKLVSVLATVEPTLGPNSEAVTLAGQSCDIATLVGQALEANEDAVASLITMDSASLPVSRATMLWDGDWVLPPTVTNAASLFHIQQSVVAAVLAAPTACQTEPMAGPQFIMLNGVNAGRTIVLVVGSGAWTWDQILPRADLDNEQGEGEWSSLYPAEETENQPTA